MKIYTRGGDDGTTGLIGGTRVSKADSRIAAVGDLDEANATLGWAVTSLEDEDLLSTLGFAQSSLFEIGAEVAAPSNDSERFQTVGLGEVARLEEDIDRLSESLPLLTNFILPGGTEAASRLHMARGATRRAERSMANVEGLRPMPQAFVNRLSDWLFVAARTVNARRSVQDTIWSRRDSR